MIYSNEDLQRAICAARSVIVAHLKDGGKIEEIAGFSPNNWTQIVTNWASATAKGQPACAQMACGRCEECDGGRGDQFCVRPINLGPGISVRGRKEGDR